MELQMTLEADYAVRIVYELASSGGRIDASALAEASGVTVRFSLKILRKLVAAGLILSYKGAAGGYELAKKPREISLCDIVAVQVPEIIEPAFPAPCSCLILEAK